MFCEANGIDRYKSVNRRNFFWLFVDPDQFTDFATGECCLRRLCKPKFFVEGFKLTERLHSSLRNGLQKLE